MSFTGVRNVLKLLHRPLPWISLAIVFAIGITLTLTLRSPLHLFAKTPPPSIKNKPLVASLRMHAEDRGDGILISWNQDSAIVRSSVGGVLRINDGLVHRDVPIDPALIANGSILYRPQSDDINFQLEVRGRQGDLITGSMRVLDGARTPRAINTYLSASVSNPTPRAALTVVVIDEPQHVRPLLSNNLQTQPDPPLPTAPPALATETEESDPAPLVLSEVSAPPSAQESAPLTSATPNILNSSEERHVPLSAPQGDSPDALSISEIRARNTPASAIVPTRPLRQVMPDLRSLGMALPVSRMIQVGVAVRVNNQGVVTDARAIPDRSSRPAYLIFAALNAAKQWTFQPATLRGQNVESDYTIVFKFGSDHN